MTRYGQFCPMAKAMEVLDERWTLLIVRELLLGSTGFNDLRRGVPRMSPALLSKRLRTLARAGVVEHFTEDGRSGYRLTDSGRELHAVVEALGQWGVRWIGELGEEDLDPHLLLWDMRRTMPVDRWPRARTVVALTFPEVAASHWWLVVSDGKVDVCDFDPGFDVDVEVRTDLRTMTSLWRGDCSWAQVLREDRARLLGSGPACRGLPEWIGRSLLSQVPRPGATSDLASVPDDREADRPLVDLTS